MTQVKLVKCDGCDAETQTELGSDTSSFYRSTVTVGAWGDTFDLCAKCHERLLDDINPKKWPRVARHVPDRAA